MRCGYFPKCDLAELGRCQMCVCLTEAINPDQTPDDLLLIVCLQDSEEALHQSCKGSGDRAEHEGWGDVISCRIWDAVWVRTVFHLIRVLVFSSYAHRKRQTWAEASSARTCSYLLVPARICSYLRACAAFHLFFTLVFASQRLPATRVSFLEKKGDVPSHVCNPDVRHTGCSSALCRFWRGTWHKQNRLCLICIQYRL